MPPVKEFYRILVKNIVFYAEDVLLYFLYNILLFINCEHKIINNIKI
jgi:hypothetical protein